MLKSVKLAVISIIGEGLVTVPSTAKFTLVAPKLEWIILPEKVPAVAPVKRT